MFTPAVYLLNGKDAKADYIVTTVYEKIDGHWLMVSHHVRSKRGTEQASMFAPFAGTEGYRQLSRDFCPYR
jgi:hypothetical protein